MANVAGFDTAPLSAGLSEPFRAFILDQNRCKAALFGTGRYSGVRRVGSSKEKTEVRLPVSEKWYARTRFPMELLLEAGDVSEPIRLMQEAVVKSAGPGLAVAVIDPERGIVVKRGLFTETPRVVWELRQVQSL